jgi:hypothetical protein
MSDEAVLNAIRVLEAWLKAPDVPLDGATLEVWHRDFNAALAGAVKGPGWQELVARGHRLAEQVERHSDAVEAQRDAIRLELQGQVQGSRALKGYESSIR